MRINLERVIKDIEYVSGISATKDFGCTRFSYSEEDKQAREYLSAELEKTGARITVDGVGNIRAKINGWDIDKPIIMVGSHIDTVKNGGPFDGLLGVVCGLEILRVISEQKMKFERGIEVVIFAEEEGSNFGSTMMGSKFFTGKYDIDDLSVLKNDFDENACDVIRGFGFDPESKNNRAIIPGEVEAMLELHIEQGQVLDSEKCQIGIVNGIFGMKNVRLTLNGVGNHAGATPMKLRRDPMILAGKIIGQVEKIVNDLDSKTAVATVGKIISIPNAANVIPSQVILYIDIRDIEEAAISLILEKIKDFIKNQGNDDIVSYKLEEVASSKPTLLSGEILSVIENRAKKSNIKYLNMFSGAVHDCVQLAGLTKVGMIFVPSIDGRSHVPEERTNFSDIETGSNLLLDTVVSLARKK